MPPSSTRNIHRAACWPMLIAIWLLPALPAQAAAQAPTNAAVLDATLVSVADIIVEGCSVYSARDLAQHLAPYRRAAVSLRQLHQLADELTVRYRRDGYILSQVSMPAQHMRNGVVRLQAQEGYITRVDLVGKAPLKRTALAGPIDALKRSRPLTATVLERNLLLINDLAGVTATAELAPAKTQVGAAQLTMRFEQRRYRGAVGANNLASRSLGRARLEGHVELYSLLERFDRTKVSFSSSGSDKSNALTVEHEQPIGATGLKAQAALSAARSRPGRSANRNLETRSDDLRIGLSYPVIRSRNKNLYAKAAVTAHRGKIDLPELRASKDQTRAVRIAASFDSTDRWQGVNSVEAELSQGIDALGAGGSTAELSRASGRSDFTKLTLQAARLQAIKPQWSLLGAVRGQYAFTDLLVPELFVFGGEQFGRGYDSAELAGDHGAAVKLELRYSGIAPQAKLSAYTLYGFWDAGRVWLRHPSAERGEKARDSAASAGVGARMNLGEQASTFVELAKPLTHPVAEEDSKRPRLMAGMNYHF